jgi:4,4'-diaponeurosporenoate glycosyltransferase
LNVQVNIVVVAVVVASVALVVMTVLVARVRLLREPTNGRVADPVVGVAEVADVAVVIPARNEERNLPLLLADLRAQTMVPVQTVVVDDHSSDRTAEFARACGASVVYPSARPAGWNPKVWALTTGVGNVNASTIVFLDADVRLGPSALSALVSDRDRLGGLVSVAPRHDAPTRVEALPMLCNVIAVAGGGPGFARQSSGAVGSCVVISRADYELVGGHAATPGTIVDDLDLARSVSRHGLAVNLRRGGQVVRMRSYPDGAPALVAGWSKNLAAGAARTRPLVGVAIASWLATLVLPIWLLIGRHWWTAVVLWLIVGVQTTFLARAVGRFNWVVASLGAPFVAVFTTMLTLRSFVIACTGRTVDWKGRRLGPDGLERSGRKPSVQSDRTSGGSRRSA